MGYLDGVDPDGFDWRAYIDQHDPRLLGSSEGRVELTRHDPLLFALLYLRHHLRSDETGGEITFSEFHFDLMREAMTWRSPRGPQEARSAWVAPRGAGKSSWAFLILPLWLLAHKHRRFVAAFADSGPQATQHLTSLKSELDNGVLLREDYSDLCKPAMRPGGVTVADRQDTYIAKSGVAFIARGIDASTLGAKIGSQRPDLIIADDLEPPETAYSLYQKAGRLDSWLSAVLPMNLSAVVVMVGTTTMAGSIMHDLVRQVTEAGSDGLPEWPTQEKIRVNYYPAIVTKDDGTEASLWPARWSLPFLNSIRKTRAYLKNFLNQPSSSEGAYWGPEDIQYGTLPTLTRRILRIDPAISSKKTSDRTGVSIVAYSPAEGRCVVEHAEGVRLTGRHLRRHLDALIARWPAPLHAAVVEVNQGGDLWDDVLEDFPLKVVKEHAAESKEVRFARALAFYQDPKGCRVLHAARFPMLEAEMFGFPTAANDDVADSVVGAVLRFLAPPVKRQAGVRRSSYT